MSVKQRMPICAAEISAVRRRFFRCRREAETVNVQKIIQHVHWRSDFLPLLSVGKPQKMVDDSLQSSAGKEQDL